MIYGNALIIVLAVLEGIAAFAVLRLWKREQGKSFFGRCFWSFVLLIPFFGLICYVFLNISPETHGEALPEYPPDLGHP
jgi:hypothetical protein